MIPFRRSMSVFAAALAAFVFQARAGAENWPQWRGPRGDGSCAESGLPVGWTTTEGVVWRAPIEGKGASTPIIWDDRIFLTSQTGEMPISRGPSAGGKVEEPVKNDGATYNAHFFVHAFAAKDGGALWTKEIKGDLLTPVHRKHNMASPSCVADEERVYAVFATGVAVAFDHAGNEIWKRDLASEYAPFAILFGHGSSPALHGEKLILTCAHEIQSYILAVDKRTGKTIYKADQEKRKTYSTPLIIKAGEREEMILNTNGRVDAYNPETGESLWRAGGLMIAEVPSPIFVDGIIYTSGGFKNPPIMAVRPGGEGDVTSTHVIWRKPSGAAYVASPVWAGGSIFLVNDEGIAKRFDPATGENTWKERLGGTFSSSPVVTADGRLYTTNEDGETFVLDVSGAEFKVISKNPLDEFTLASPAVSNGAIYLRTDKALYKIGPGGKPNIETAPAAESAPAAGGQ